MQPSIEGLRSVSYLNSKASLKLAEAAGCITDSQYFSTSEQCAFESLTTFASINGSLPAHKPTFRENLRIRDGMNQ